MDRGAEYAQSGCHKHNTHVLSVTATKQHNTTDQASTATSSAQNSRSTTVSGTTIPQSDYGAPSQSARSSGFPQDHRRYPQYALAHYYHQGAAFTMAQPPNPSSSQASWTYLTYSLCPPDQSIYQGYQLPYGYMPQQRPSHEQWGAYSPQHMSPYDHPRPSVQGPPPTSDARPGQVYSFVPIPGAQQHKRPRRRYEEVERMYKCGYNGCEKTYGTLNHLNAHVTLQSHGNRRTPEESKKIRKEWKARKTREENARKAEDERARHAAQAQQADGQTSDGRRVQGQVYQQNGARPSLPSIDH